MTMTPMNTGSTGNAGVPAPGISLQEALAKADLPADVKETVQKSIDKVNLTIVENFLPTEEEQKLMERKRKEDDAKAEQAELVQQERLVEERGTEKPSYI